MLDVIDTNFIARTGLRINENRKGYLLNGFLIDDQRKKDDPSLNLNRGIIKV